MECVVRKLKAGINNANLPVYENIVFKNYITTTADGQYIALSDIPHQLNKNKMECVFESPVNNVSVPVLGSSPDQYLSRVNGYVRAINQGQGALTTIAANVEVHAGFDTSDGSFFINNDTGTCTNPSTSTVVARQMLVFATVNRYASKAGALKIKSVKITNYNNDVYNLVPAEINGVAVLYDVDRGTTYGEVNGGTLVCG